MVVYAGGVGEFAVLLHDRVPAGLHADGVQIIVARLGLPLPGGAVPEAGVCEQLRQHRLVVAVPEGDVVVGEEGHDQREQQQQHDQREGHHGALVLAEAQPGVLEVANGLGLQLLVVDAGIGAHEPEFFPGDLLHILFIHHFFDPILIRGSINP